MTRPGRAFPRRSCRNDARRNARSERVSWVDERQTRQRFPGPEFAARDLFGSEGRCGARASRSATISSISPPPSELARRRMARRSCRSRSSTPGLSRGPEAHRALRQRLSEILTDERYRDDVEMHLIGQSEVRLHVPCLIGDYTDFYVGIHHATNVGRQFRPDNPLLPNYKYVPIGYHGRASSVRAVGRAGRPAQRASASRPTRTRPNMARAAASITSSSSASGSGAAMSSASRSRSARRAIISPAIACSTTGRRATCRRGNISRSGPFLAKNFLTSVTPWIVSPEALAPFRSPMPPRPEGDPAAAALSRRFRGS